MGVSLSDPNASCSSMLALRDLGAEVSGAVHVIRLSRVKLLRLCEVRTLMSLMDADHACGASNGPALLF